MVRDPQVQARDMVVEIQHPVHGTITEVGVPIKLSDTPGSVRQAAPATGEHTDEVLRGLGFSADEIAGLRQRRVVA
jgi:crotonobetainyl-CoA:carnitine CoA-transferase CaiB-like acyl-CoA transferase